MRVPTPQEPQEESESDAEEERVPIPQLINEDDDLDTDQVTCFFLLLIDHLPEDKGLEIL